MSCERFFYTVYLTGSISGDSGHKAGCVRYRGQDARLSQDTIAHTFTDNLETPISLHRMSSDCGRKPLRHGETMQTLHVAEAGIKPPNPRRCEANLLTIKLPCPTDRYILKVKEI